MITTGYHKKTKKLKFIKLAAFSTNKFYNNYSYRYITSFNFIYKADADPILEDTWDYTRQDQNDFLCISK